MENKNKTVKKTIEKLSISSLSGTIKIYKPHFSQIFMSNERITEDFVREHFKNDGMYKSIKFEEQISRNKIIKELLSKASKNKTGKAGRPEFIITFPSLIDFVIVVECKSDKKFHQSKDGKDPINYAVDGVLHYSEHLKKDFNVIGIAVSGDKKEDLSISNFFIEKNKSNIKELTDKTLLNLYDYLNIIEQKETAEKLKDKNLLLFASDLNKDLYNYSVPENERATIVSGVLIGLQDKTFRNSYMIDKKPYQLVEDLLRAIQRVLESKDMGSKTKILIGEYSKIAQSNNLSIKDKIRNPDTGEDEKNYLLRDLIFLLDKKIFPYTQYEHIGYDILGQFYSEFISYVYGDKKLGLVLTPQHITELFIDIANLSKDDVVYDSCCGTAGFLIKAMKRLLKLSENDTKKKSYIKQNQLVGVESRSDMFTYACSNMMMRGDGKSNIYLGDSLSNSMKDDVKKHHPTIGFLNPPYSTNISELEFIYNNLECIEKNGLCVAIIPMSCVLAQSGKDLEWKKKLLQNHTLEAVMSMPDEVFYPVGTVTCIIVFKAKIPHNNNKETWFGYWKEDGFIKVKNLGRVDFQNNWESIKKEWLEMYVNKKIIPEKSIMKKVTANDEWCAEAYLETDYSNLNEDMFINTLKDYVSFKMTK